MSPVGGSRHYQGGGLGEIGIWSCPSCGDDNDGPLSQGCTHCGAGRPATTPPIVLPPAPPIPRVSERTPEDPTYQPPPSPAAAQEVENEYTAWIKRHPDATPEQAFIAGYIEGIRAAARAQREQQPPPAAGVTTTPPQTLSITAEVKTYRTIVAALAVFRDQILSGEPAEIAEGEWMGVEETTLVISQLQEQLHG